MSDNVLLQQDPRTKGMRACTCGKGALADFHYVDCLAVRIASGDTRDADFHALKAAAAKLLAMWIPDPSQDLIFEAREELRALLEKLS